MKGRLHLERKYSKCRTIREDRQADRLTGRTGKKEDRKEGGQESRRTGKEDRKEGRHIDRGQTRVQEGGRR
jgi:hypothetical protein